MYISCKLKVNWEIIINRGGLNLSKTIPKWMSHNYVIAERKNLQNCKIPSSPLLLSKVEYLSVDGEISQ